MLKDTLKSYVDEIIHDDTPVERKIAGLSTVLSLLVFGIIVFISYKLPESVTSMDNYYFYLIGTIAIIPTVTLLISRAILFSIYKHNPESFTKVMKFLSDLTDFIFVLVFLVLLIMFTKDELSSGNSSSKDILLTLWSAWIVAAIVIVIRVIGRRKR